MSRYSANEIHFNLMALISDRRMIYEKEVSRLQEQFKALQDQVFKTDTVMHFCQRFLLWKDSDFCSSVANNHEIKFNISEELFPKCKDNTVSTA